MPATQRGRGELKRVSLTLPEQLHDGLTSASRQQNITKVAAIRLAIAAWLEEQAEAEMAAGYTALAQDSARIMEEFEQVDRENW